MNKLLISALVSVGLLGAAPVISAQTGSPAQSTQREAGKRAFTLPSERIEARLAYIRTALKITAQQQPQWDAYANALRSRAQAADQRFKARFEQGAKAQPRAPMNAVERLEFRQKRLAEAAQRTGEMVTVTKPLYAALSAEQRAVADQVLAPRGGRGGFGHRGGGHRGGHGGGHGGMHRGV